MLVNEFEKLALRKFKIKSILPDATILILGKRRCFKRGTKVLMYDGTSKCVEDIVCGDIVMGDDSFPRNVLDTHSGYDKLYKVTNKKGESYTVNGDHILSLFHTDKKNIVDIPVKDYLLLSKKNKEKLLNIITIPFNILYFHMCNNTFFSKYS